jgi:AraC-like DNA-binding protein
MMRIEWKMARFIIIFFKAHRLQIRIIAPFPNTKLIFYGVEDRTNIDIFHLIFDTNLVWEKLITLRDLNNHYPALHMQQKQNQNIRYLVVNQTDETWGLYITTIGFQSIPSNSQYPPKEHPSSYWFKPQSGRKLQEFQLLYITSGEGVFESTHCKSTNIVAGTILLLFPNEWHTYKPSKNTGWDEYWIGFKGEFIENLERNGFINKNNPIINIGFNEQIITLFKQAIEVSSFQKTAYQQMLAGITSNLISYIFYVQKNNAFRDKEAVILIEKARMMMREESEENSSPQLIAKKLNLSYSWFRRIFKQYTGLSPAQYLMEIKIQKSKEMLNSSTMTIKEIAYALNFLNVSYFVTFFKSRTGIPPGDYRNKAHGKKE